MRELPRRHVVDVAAADPGGIGVVHPKERSLGVQPHAVDPREREFQGSGGPRRRLVDQVAGAAILVDPDHEEVPVRGLLDRGHVPGDGAAEDGLLAAGQIEAAQMAELGLPVAAVEKSASVAAVLHRPRVRGAGRRIPDRCHLSRSQVEAVDLVLQDRDAPDQEHLLPHRRPVRHGPGTLPLQHQSVAVRGHRIQHVDVVIRPVPPGAGVGDPRTPGLERSKAGALVPRGEENGLGVVQVPPVELVLLVASHVRPVHDVAPVRVGVEAGQIPGEGRSEAGFRAGRRDRVQPEVHHPAWHEGGQAPVVGEPCAQGAGAKCPSDLAQILHDGGPPYPPHPLLGDGGRLGDPDDGQSEYPYPDHSHPRHHAPLQYTTNHASQTHRTHLHRLPGPANPGPPSAGSALRS